MYNLAQFGNILVDIPEVVPEARYCMDLACSIVDFVQVLYNPP